MPHLMGRSSDTLRNGVMAFRKIFWVEFIVFVWDRSGITLDKVVHVINIREIHYRLINLNVTNLAKMVELFKTNFTNFEETTLADAKDLNIKVSDMIIRELLPDVDYND
jgi:autonomous glycyl radical cofactor GrcA